METFLVTLVSLGFALALACACGYGVVTFLLPAEYRAYRLVVMPATGYLAFCLLVMIVSGNFAASVRISVWIALAALGLLALAAFHHERKSSQAGAFVGEARLVAILMLPTAVIVLWPVLIQGAELYLGSVNLDFFQSLIYQELLRRHDLSVFAHHAAPSERPSLELAAHMWPDTTQARFGGVMFSYLLQSITGLSAKSSLTVAIGVFALCVPLSVYFFSRVVLALAHRTAVVSSAIIGISAPVSLGFLYVLVGQGSGMPILPLLIAAHFIALTQPSPRIIAYCAILVAGLFWLYASMLPFALAPMGLLALHLMLRRRLRFTWGLGIFGGVVVGMLVAWGGMLPYLREFFKGLAEVSGRLVGSFYFSDFLTELFFVYFLGLTSYTWNNSIVYFRVREHVPIGMAWALAASAAVWLLVFLGAALVSWWRNQPDDARRTAMAALLAVYSFLWVYFTFVKPYGYSVFKMAMWLQFVMVPILAHGMVHFWSLGPGSSPKLAARCAVLVTGILFGTTNLIAALDYGDMSFGRNRLRGGIINAFGMGENPELAALGRDLSVLVSRDQAVGIGFTDAVQNNWAAYRLIGVAKHSILSHELQVEDDSLLPDPRTGLTRDSSGELKRFAPLHYADIASDFYLLPAESNQNPEIVEQRLPQPTWKNSTFALHAGRALKDYLFLGRGFYRAEFSSGKATWWEPSGPSRWSRNGGEFYLLHPTRPGKPYRLSFTAMVGFGYPSASRTLEFWHDGRKFDEVTVNDIARIRSAPFFPKANLDRVSVVIREKTRPFARLMALWHAEVPDDTRSLNLHVSSVRLVHPEDTLPSPIGRAPIVGKEILQQAHLFNGLSAAGWVPASASFALVAPFDHPRAIVEIIIPGNLGFTFPYRVNLIADEVDHAFVAKGPGKLRLEVPLPEANANELVSFEIRPQEHRLIDNAFANKNRPIIQSVHLESVQLSPTELSSPASRMSSAPQ